MLEDHFADLLARADVSTVRESVREIGLPSEAAFSLMLVHADRSYPAVAAKAANAVARGCCRAARPARDEAHEQGRAKPNSAKAASTNEHPHW
jgi:hypothetical protein